MHTIACRQVKMWSVVLCVTNRQAIVLQLFHFLTDRHTGSATLTKNYLGPENKPDTLTGTRLCVPVRVMFLFASEQAYGSISVSQIELTDRLRMRKLKETDRTTAPSSILMKGR